MLPKNYGLRIGHKMAHKMKTVILLKFLRTVHVSTVYLHKLSKKDNVNFRYRYTSPFSVKCQFICHGDIPFGFLEQG